MPSEFLSAFFLCSPVSLASKSPIIATTGERRLTQSMLMRDVWPGFGLSLRSAMGKDLFDLIQREDVVRCPW